MVTRWERSSDLGNSQRRSASSFPRNSSCAGAAKGTVRAHDFVSALEDRVVASGWLWGSSGRLLPNVFGEENAMHEAGARPRACFTGIDRTVLQFLKDKGVRPAARFPIRDASR